MHVVYVGAFGQQTGYAQACHDYLLALHRHGVSLEIWPIAPVVNVENRYEELIPLLETRDKEPTHLVIHTVPAAAVPALDVFLPEVQNRASSKVKAVLVTTWETDRLPPYLADAVLGWYDEVIVPSGFCAEAIDDDEIVHVVPHCFDPAHWQRKNEPRDSDEYRFYSILNWGERKNPIGLLKAYLAEFSAEDNVSLTIKLPPGSNPRADVEALYACLGYSIEEAPRLKFAMDSLTHDELVAFHSAHDCFVTAARGEGWNLPAFEALVLGNKLISPAWGGHSEFAPDFPRYQSIDYSLTPVIVPPQPGQSFSFGEAVLKTFEQKAPNGLTIRQSWCEPNLDHLRFAMRAVTDAPRLPYEYRQEKYTYKHVAPLFVKALEGRSNDDETSIG